MKYFKLGFILISFSYAQISLSGIVIDKKNENPIPNVNIYESKSKKGLTTNLEGFFSITIENQYDASLSFSHIAYEEHHQYFDQSLEQIIITMDETLIHLDDIVVTSTRSGYILRDVPVATEVIGTKEINESGAITISNLLEQRAGVSISTNVDGGAIFNMLGLDSRYILILKDGQPITGQFNNRVDLNQISTNGLKKIEIIKGPGSAIYGTDAMAGVINIISEDPSNTLNMEVGYRVSSFGGNTEQILEDYPSSVVMADIKFPLNKFFISTNITYQNFRRGQEFEYINADKIKKININNDINWRSSNHQIRFSYQTYDQLDEGTTNLSNGFILFTNETDIFRNEFNLSHKWKLNHKLSIDQTIRNANYGRNYTVKNSEGKISNQDKTSEKNIEYELLFNAYSGSKTINGGIELSKPKYISDRINGGIQEKNIFGVFNQIIWDINTRTDLITGLRFDNHIDTLVISPRLAFSYEYNDKWIYRVAYGHGFRAPSFMESLIDWDHIQFGYSVLGNPDLKPEISKGITINAEFRNRNNFQGNILLYHNSFSNLIKDYAIRPGLLSYRNIERAYFTGLEIISKWTINQRLSSSINLNYVINKDEDNNIIPNTIPLSAGARFSYAPGNQKLLFTLNLKGVGKYYPQEFDPASGDYNSSGLFVNPYLIMDAQIIFKINSLYKIILGSKNFGNHTNQAYGPYLGRTVYCEIKTNYKH